MHDTEDKIREAKTIAGDNAAEIMFLAKELCDLEPNAEHVLFDFCEQILFAHALKEYEFDSMYRRQLDFEIEKLLKKYPCEDENKIEGICRFAAVCFAALFHAEKSSTDSKLTFLRELIGVIRANAPKTESQVAAVEAVFSEHYDWD